MMISVTHGAIQSILLNRITIARYRFHTLPTQNLIFICQLTLPYLTVSTRKIPLPTLHRHTTHTSILSTWFITCEADRTGHDLCRTPGFTH